ncbi:paxillin-like [Tropilaelaps mercedesae]|uniref:Paxillin-like n=1 Tax=Tropilaelaps mercedesae TaxID=418985 RepID=A0A1V9Y1F9_9ACAR|nr:paxillin-like [Tropilaelaps mercedesae]
MENLDNLLADLQSSRREYEVSYKRTGSVERRENSSRTTTSSLERPVTPVQIVPETATKDLQYTYQMHDPIYQNSHVIKETITAHGTSERAQSPIRAANNLSHLDSIVRVADAPPLSNGSAACETTSEYMIRTEQVSSTGSRPKSPAYTSHRSTHHYTSGYSNSLPRAKSPSSYRAKSPCPKVNFNHERMVDELRSTIPKTTGRSGYFVHDSHRDEYSQRRYTQSTEPAPTPQSYKVYSYAENRSSTGSRPPSRPRTPIQGSSATQELDSLMASLSEFRLQDPTYVSGHLQRSQRKEARTLVSATSSHSTPPPPPPPPPPSGRTRDSALDSMLGSLREDMNAQGVTGGAGKGCCSSCKKPIVGQVVTALGRMWHPEHFVCAHCNQELGTRNFYERDGEPYCEQDYHNIFSPRCSYCNGPILDKCVTALDRTWHPEHFFCAQCGRQFGDEGFHEKDAKPYCREDYFAMFAPKCAGCSMPITENYISALSMQWHPECFVCRDCLQPFQGGSFYDYEGQPYCETHYHAKRGSLCAGCHKPISGRCITAMFRKYHPEHFVCSFCLKQLNKGTFKEENDKPYCHDCFEKLYS